MTDETKYSLSFEYLPVRQPIGEFYIASIPANKLVEITDFDVRRVIKEERDVEKYLGVQRKLNNNRVKEISAYVRTLDACFPTAVIIAVQEKCVKITDNIMTLMNYNHEDTKLEEERVLVRQIARVLDGQHRLAGLDGMEDEFEINVSIFVDADISDQAAIFSTVNLAQTKVNRSLAYDLFDLMESRSPQKICHNITVTLDREKDSPFYRMIKRLGVATPGRTNETLTQATVVDPILRFVSTDPMADRDLYMRKKKPEKVDEKLLEKHPFQHMFVDEKDYEITDIIWNYFKAIQKRWPEAWESRERGNMINRTNGYRAFMRLLAKIYLNMFTNGQVPNEKEFADILRKVSLTDSQFDSKNYLPGSSGESELFHQMMADIKLT